ncbi:MAG: phage tail protein [Marinilabiliales bacterium]|nr:phage tail protein [Marinilabiliales bacterium]
MTLERGATQDRDLFDWFQDVAITLERPRPHRRDLQAQPRHRPAGPRRHDAAALVAVACLAGEVRRRRLGQRGRRERHRVGHAHLRLLRAGAVGGCPHPALGRLCPPGRPGTPGGAKTMSEHHHLPVGPRRPNPGHEGSRGAYPRRPQARPQRCPARADPGRVLGGDPRRRALRLRRASRSTGARCSRATASSPCSRSASSRTAPSTPSRSRARTAAAALASSGSWTCASFR